MGRGGDGRGLAGGGGEERMEGDLQGEEGKRGWEGNCSGRSGGEDGRGPA